MSGSLALSNTSSQFLAVYDNHRSTDSTELWTPDDRAAGNSAMSLTLCSAVSLLVASIQNTPQNLAGLVRLTESTAEQTRLTNPCSVQQISNKSESSPHHPFHITEIVSGTRLVC